MKIGKQMLFVNTVVIIILGTAYTAQAQSVYSRAERVKDLSQVVRQQGLSPQWYLSESVEAKIQNLIAAGQSVQADAEIKKITTRIAKDLYSGRVSPTKVQSKAKIAEKKFIHTVAVDQFLNEQISTEQLVSAVTPKHRSYSEALSAYQRLVTIQSQMLWTAKPAGLKIVKAQENLHNPALVQYLRLKLNDFGYQNNLTNPIFDYELNTVVRQFQQDHNLKTDGIVGNVSWSFLERSIEKLITQAVINLDRTRWLPDDLSNQYIIVNLAQQRLQFFQNHQMTMDFATINGRLDRQTPMLVDQIKYVVLNPTWTVPVSIFMKDKLPELRKDPGYIATHNMRIVDDVTGTTIDPYTVDWNQDASRYNRYTIIQSPGPWNALGFIKFPLTNPYAIYLHDTNDRSLFSQEQRLFSSGCVRTVQPFELAEKILNTPEWSVDSLKNATEYLPMVAMQPTNLKPVKKTAVYLFYKTVFYENDGRLISLTDHYGTDKLMLPLLNQ